ncbi:MAG: hypothetical protein J6A05_10520 [Oscillospiraceae bacterium]|nr:hypothetical protein [Oscillospiraceae bacterium]
MDYIKKSFKKIFLTILIFCAAFTAFDMLVNWVSSSVYWHFADEKGILQANMLEYLSMMNNMSNNWFVMLMSLLGMLVTAPLSMGLYSFCFARLRGEPTSIRSLFDFYTSPKRFFGSFVAKNLVAAAVTVAAVIITLTFGLFFTFAAEDSGSATAVTLATMVVGAISAIAAIVIIIFFFFTEYGYALFPEDGVINAVRNSFALTKRYWLKIAGIMLLSGAVNYVFSALLHRLPFFDMLSFIPTSVTTWVGVIFVHYVLSGDKPKAESEQAEEETDEDLVVKPYDFFIEADTRFTDSKTFEAEAIREVDILAVLDEMNLADEVKTNWGVKRKLKRLFDDLAFEVGEYVTYEGGREISGTEIEELDERELEISVEISRGSDSEPFTAVVSISEVEE